VKEVILLTAFYCFFNWNNLPQLLQNRPSTFTDSSRFLQVKRSPFQQTDIILYYAKWQQDRMTKLN